MTTQYYGATLVLNTTPTPDRTEEIARGVAAENFPQQPFNYGLTDTLPEGTPVDVYDQLTAVMRDLPEGATYMLVYPVDETDSST